MPVLDRIPVELTAEEILEPQGRKPVRPELVHQAQAAIELGQTLWQPRAVYERYAIRRVGSRQVEVLPLDGVDPLAAFDVGPRADLLDQAREVLVGVGTLGPALEGRVQQLQAERGMVEAFLLDSAGVVALGAVGESLRCLAEEMATEQSWGVSAALSPGSLVGWSLRGQREVCGLLPLDQIGVRLNSYYVLEPHKSFSAVIGLGPGYETARVGSVCRFCSLQDTCWRRREDPS